uniref:Delta5 fatty acid desaturase A n=1 Tax=Caligus rogercresseyi TaxID=217165 RepID=C1BPG9_CALRO|nr:Delta5 fatty acid desaturase A [Caligus rogercresseyi]
MPPSITKTESIHEASSASFIRSQLPEKPPIGDTSLQVENRIYDAQELAKFHPGGELFVKAFAGRDATLVFLSYHRKKFPHNRVSFALETVDPTVRDQDVREVDEDYLELCRRVHKVIPSHKTFATWHYYAKVFTLMIIALSLEGYMHYYGEYTSLLAISIGLCYASIGLNIQHDGNHGAISRRPWINRLGGLSMNYIGHSSVDWVHQHVVQHHIYTNDVDLDPDIDGTFIYRLNPIKPLLQFHALQYIYYFLIINMYGVTLSFYTLENLVKGVHFTSLSTLAQKYWKWESLGPLLLILRLYVLPLIRVPSIWTLLNMALLMGVFGHYVAFFFILSHNFVGVHHSKGETKIKSFAYKQAACSSNVGGRLLAFFNGGLNYQIEHHLFPRMCHIHYPTVAPIVRAFCEEKSIPYHHFPTITENFVSTAEHLLSLGTEENPESLKFL